MKKYIFLIILLFNKNLIQTSQNSKRSYTSPSLTRNKTTDPAQALLQGNDSPNKWSTTTLYRDPTFCEECQADCWQDVRNCCLKGAYCCGPCTAICSTIGLLYSDIQEQLGPEYPTITERDALTCRALSCLGATLTTSCFIAAYKAHQKMKFLRSKKPLPPTSSSKMN